MKPLLCFDLAALFFHIALKVWQRLTARNFLFRQDPKSNSYYCRYLTSMNKRVTTSSDTNLWPGLGSICHGNLPPSWTWSGCDRGNPPQSTTEVQNLWTLALLLRHTFLRRQLHIRPVVVVIIALLSLLAIIYDGHGKSIIVPIHPICWQWLIIWTHYAPPK